MKRWIGVPKILLFELESVILKICVCLGGIVVSWERSDDVEISDLESEEGVQG